MSVILRPTTSISHCERQMNIRKKLYFIGWDYTTPHSVMLKRALMNDAFPWQPTAIVHDAVWVDSVDGIPLMLTENFLEIASAGQVSAVLVIKDEFHRALWLRHVRDHGITLIDEGELFREYAALLKAEGNHCQLGIMDLPDAFDDEAHQALSAYKGLWKDATSNCIFNTYLNFLETGLISQLRGVTQYNSEHPFFQPQKSRLTELFNEAKTGLIWEIANARSAFLEQAVFQGSNGALDYAFSAMDDVAVKAEAKRLMLLLKSLGIEPAISQLKMVDGFVTQQAVAEYSVPDLSIPRKLVRIDVDDPVDLLDLLDQTSEVLCAWVRIGKTPRQLLRVLEKFAIDDLSLRCDRPGPLGLQLLFSKNCSV